jgi:hypothetical protein
MWIPARFPFVTPSARKNHARSATASRRRRRALFVERLEDRTVPNASLTVSNLVVTGSNGAMVVNAGTWFDDPGTTLSLTASAGNVALNADSTWSWSLATPTGAPLSQVITITGNDGSAYEAFATFYLNPTVRTVCNSNDSGPGSLRQAIADTNADITGVDEITFNLPGTGPFTIQPGSPLEPVSTPVFINGYSQPGSSPNTLPNQGPGAGDNAVPNITVDGRNYNSPADGLAIAAGYSTVQGLTIQNFANAIHLMTQGNDVVQGNVMPSAAVVIDSVPNNTVGGTAPGARNVCASIAIYGGGGNVLEGNYIDTNGIQVLGVGEMGISGSDNILGGTAPGAGNVIAGHDNGDAAGVNIFGDGNVVQQNYIGLDAAGTSTINGLGSDQYGNSLYGVYIWTGNNNIIGGTSPSARNVISGWLGMIIMASGAATTNVVEGNYLGTNAAGTEALPSTNPSEGIEVDSGQVVIGGSTPGSGNLIVDTGVGLNLGAGVFGSCLVEGNQIQDCAGGGVLDYDTGDVIAANTIASNRTGVQIAGTNISVEGNSIYQNTGPGVVLVPGCTENAVEGNAIHDNTGPGVWIQGDSLFGYATGNSIEANSIYNNGQRGIVLGDIVDAAGNLTPPPYPAGTPQGLQTWANNSQIYPFIRAAQSSSTSTTITGTLTSTAYHTFRLEFFSNIAADPSGYGQGQTFLGSAEVTTGGSGNPVSSPDGSAVINADASFTVTLPTPVLAGQNYLTATATDMTTGDTSEFSPDFAIPAANQAPITSQNLQALLSAVAPTGGSRTVFLAATTADEAHTIIAAANGLSAATTQHPTLWWTLPARRSRTRSPLFRPRSQSPSPTALSLAARRR